MVQKALGDLEAAEAELIQVVALDEAIGHPDLESDRYQTDLPVLPVWTETLWRHTESNWNLAEQLYSYGDALHAYRIKHDADWSNLLTRLLWRKEIQIPEH